MITVCLDYRKKKLTVSGHAERPSGVPPGQNIICAAVSALTLTLMGGLEEVAHDDIEAIAEGGNVEITWEELSDIGNALVDTWLSGVKQLQEAYGEITII